MRGRKALFMLVLLGTMVPFQVLLQGNATWTRRLA